MPRPMRIDRGRPGSGVEARAPDDIAEMRPRVSRHRRFEDVHLPRRVCGAGLVAESVRERADDAPLEVRAGMRGDDGVALLGGELVEVTAGDVVLHPPVDEPD